MNTPGDEAREALIHRCFRYLLAARTPTARRHAFAAMCGLINGRSREQVMRMERARGLR